jgi:hypothetical protein
MNIQLRANQLLRIFFVVSVCFLCGCQYDPWADGFLKNQAAEKDLVGTYRVDADTLTRPISIPMTKAELFISRDAEIALSADHTAKFLNVPEIDDRTNKPCFISGAGTWQQNRNSNYVQINVEILRTNDSSSADGCGTKYYEALMLYGKKPPYKLHITIGDPDSGDVLQFERVR